jgi:hypothetical protein
MEAGVEASSDKADPKHDTFLPTLTWLAPGVLNQLNAQPSFRSVNQLVFPNMIFYPKFLIISRVLSLFYLQKFKNQVYFSRLRV